MWNISCNKMVIPVIPPSVNLLEIINSFIAKTAKLVPKKRCNKFLKFQTLCHSIPSFLYFFFIFRMVALCKIIFMYPKRVSSRIKIRIHSIAILLCINIFLIPTKKMPPILRGSLKFSDANFKMSKARIGHCCDFIKSNFQFGESFFDSENHFLIPRIIF